MVLCRHKGVDRDHEGSYILQDWIITYSSQKYLCLRDRVGCTYPVSGHRSTIAVATLADLVRLAAYAPYPLVDSMPKLENRSNSLGIEIR